METFSIPKDAIKGRLDPFFYRRAYQELDKTIMKSRFEVTSVGEIAKKIVDGPFGSQLKVEEYQPSGFPLIRVSNVKTGELDGEFVFISEKKQEQLKRSRVLPNDVLLTKAGAILGYSAVFPSDMREGNITSHLVAITCDGKIIPEYLSVFFRSKVGQKQIYRWGNKSTRPELNTEEVKRILITVPPLEIQKKIIKVFYTAKDAQKKKEAEAERLLDSIDDFVLGELGIKMPSVNDLMCYALDAVEAENSRADAYYHQPKFHILENSLKSSRYPIRKLGEYITRIHYGASLKNDYASDGIPFLRIKNFESNRFDLSEVVRLPEERREAIGNAFVHKGDLLISRSGSVGIVAVVPKEADGFAFGSFMIRFCLTEDINKDFVSFWLNNKFSKIFIEREKIGAIQGNITIETIQGFKVPIPPLKIQDALVEQVKVIMLNAEKLKQEAQAELEAAKQKVEEMILGE